MFKAIWAKIKGFFTNTAKSQIMGLIDQLDDYKDDLAKEIDKRMTSEKISEVVIEFVKTKLKELVEAIL